MGVHRRAYKIFLTRTAASPPVPVQVGVLCNVVPIRPNRTSAVASQHRLSPVTRIDKHCPPCVDAEAAKAVKARLGKAVEHCRSSTDHGRAVHALLSHCAAREKCVPSPVKLRRQKDRRQRHLLDGSVLPSAHAVHPRERHAEHAAAFTGGRLPYDRDTRVWLKREQRLRLHVVAHAQLPVRALHPPHPLVGHKHQLHPLDVRQVHPLNRVKLPRQPSRRLTHVRTKRCIVRSRVVPQTHPVQRVPAVERPRSGPLQPLVRVQLRRVSRAHCATYVGCS
mmetsp:Transcript_3835/g.11438  ORF Transcript_3835/g.11438 Transcript_3835/m.11438 type:complete len:279 (-) Transcript_3835:183-1019(-)